MSVAGAAAIVDPETLAIQVQPTAAPSPRSDQYPLSQTIVDFPAAG